MTAFAVTPTPVPTAIRPASSFDSTRISASCPPERSAEFMFATSSAEVYLLTMSVNGRVRPAIRPPMPTTVPCMVSPAAAFALKTFAYDADATQQVANSRHRNVLLFMPPPVRSPGGASRTYQMTTRRVESEGCGLSSVRIHMRRRLSIFWLARIIHDRGPSSPCGLVPNLAVDFPPDFA